MMEEPIYAVLSVMLKKHNDDPARNYMTLEAISALAFPVVGMKTKGKGSKKPKKQDVLNVGSAVIFDLMQKGIIMEDYMEGGPDVYMLTEAGVKIAKKEEIERKWAALDAL